jgi:hypothetical protein
MWPHSNQKCESFVDGSYLTIDQAGGRNHGDDRDLVCKTPAGIDRGAAGASPMLAHD